NIVMLIVMIDLVWINVLVITTIQVVGWMYFVWANTARMTRINMTGSTTTTTWNRKTTKSRETAWTRKTTKAWNTIKAWTTTTPSTSQSNYSRFIWNHSQIGRASCR